MFRLVPHCVVVVVVALLADIFNHSSPTTTVPSMVPSQSPSTMVPSKSAIELMLTRDYRGGLPFPDHDESLYVMQALRYVEATATTDMEDWRLAQRYALSCLYFASNGVATEYTNTVVFTFTTDFSMPWLQKWTADATSGNECDWPGVVCSNDVTDSAGQVYGQVLELNLAKNLLMGSLPIELTILKDTLQVMDVEGNYLWNAGPANVWWLGELTQLQVLNLGDNAISYSSSSSSSSDGPDATWLLPPEWSQLTQLRELSLQGTYLTGQLNEDVFANMQDLEYLDVGGLNLQGGPLPSSLASLPKLYFLYLDHCNVGETVATSLLAVHHFEALQEVWADGNPNLTGTIPPTIGQKTNLTSLSMGSCGLTGTIPTELACLTALKQVWLYDNALTGSIPSDFTTHNSLQRLYLHDTDLQGTMPASLCLNHMVGLLDFLTTDCSANGEEEVTCDTTTCCTCCGSDCPINQ